MSPILSNSQRDHTGPRIGRTPDTDTIVSLDQFNPERNGPHTFVFGEPNTGKTHDTKLTVSRALNEYPELEVILVDPLDEYTAITDTQYSTTTYTTKRIEHNPFAIPSKDLSTDVFEATVENGVAYLCSVLFEYGITVESETEQLLSEIIREAYREAQILPESPSHSSSTPTFGDVVAVTRSLATRSQTGQLRELIEPLAHHWETTDHLYGTDKFNEFTEQQITRFNVPQESPSHLIGVLNEIYRYTTTTDTPTMVVIDEADRLFSTTPPPPIVAYIQRLLEQGKKTETSYTAIFEQPKPVIKAFGPSWIRENIGYSRVYSLSTFDYAKLLGFDPQYRGFVEQSFTQQTESHSLLVLYSPQQLVHIPVKSRRSSDETLTLVA